MSRIAPDRRQFLTSSVAGSAGLALLPWASQLAAAAPSAKAKACILIFLEGGPSHIDTFDPKPGAPTGGPFTPVDTNVPGIQLNQPFPKLAQVMDKLALVRSLTSKEGDHDRATVLLHTGYSPVPALEYPSLGAIVAKERAEAADVAPSFVSFGETNGGGFLGPEFGPYVVQDAANPALRLTLPEGFAEQRMAQRVQALEQLNLGFARRLQSTQPLAFTRLSTRADRMRQSPAFQAYDPAAEEPQLWATYGGPDGDGYLARCVMLARRMVENGVRFIEIRTGGWDTHGDNFNQVQTLSAPLDAALSGLISDLAQRGLLDQTLVACFGEFGRTPTINGDNGRDHWSDVFSAVLAGGGVAGGKVVGASDEQGAAVKDRPVSVPDLHASLFSAFGIDPARQYTTPDGRPIHLTNKGSVVSELF